MRIALARTHGATGARPRAVDQHDESGGWVWTRRVATAESGRAGSGRSVEPARATSGAAAGASAPATIRAMKARIRVRPSLGGRGIRSRTRDRTPAPNPAGGVEIGCAARCHAKNHIPAQAHAQTQTDAPLGARDLLELLRVPASANTAPCAGPSAAGQIQNQAVESEEAVLDVREIRCGFRRCPAAHSRGASACRPSRSARDRRRWRPAPAAASPRSSTGSRGNSGGNRRSRVRFSACPVFQFVVSAPVTL